MYSVYIHYTWMPDLTIRFDPASGVPAVRQITDNLRVVLVDKKLQPGASLPSVRRLAIELGVHFNTVAEAYRQLAAEGWLELRHGRAAVVVIRSAPEAVTEDWLGQFRDRLRGLVAQMRAEGADAGELAAELRATAERVVRS